MFVHSKILVLSDAYQYLVLSDGNFFYVDIKLSPEFYVSLAL